MDYVERGLVDEDEEVHEITDREYWLKRGTEATVKMADEMLSIVNEVKAGFTLKYNKFYIGLAKDGIVNNFVLFRPKKNYMRVDLKLPKSEDTDKVIEKNELEEMDYDIKWGRYRIRFNKGDIKKHQEVLKELITTAESQSNR